MEQAVEDVFKQGRFVLESFADLAGISLEAVGGFLGEIEQALRPASCSLSGTWTICSNASTSVSTTTPSDFAILAASATRPMVKITSRGGRAEERTFPIDQNVAGNTAQQCAERPAESQAHASAARTYPKSINSLWLSRIQRRGTKEKGRDKPDPRKCSDFD